MNSSRFSKTWLAHLARAGLLCLVASLAQGTGGAAEEAAAPKDSDAKASGAKEGKAAKEDTAKETKGGGAEAAKKGAKKAKESKEGSDTADKEGGAKEGDAKEGAEKKTEGESSADDATVRYNNWFDLSMGGLRVHGDQAEFQRQYREKRGAFGGVEDFHFEQRVGKKGSFQADGRGIVDNHDYALTLELARPDLGFLRGGFKEFRTWYDGNGGFFPQNGQWFTLNNSVLALDRGEAWFEGGLTLPDKPVFTFKYTHQWREGQKDSTSWGDSALTGGFGPRGIVPTFMDVNEQRDIFEGNLKHTIGKTDFAVGLRYELEDNQDSLNIHRRPGEPNPGFDRYVTEKEGIQADLFNVHASSITRFNDKTQFTTGWSFTTLDSDISGSRIYGANYDPVYDPIFARQANPGFMDLVGGSQMKQYVVDLNLFSTPWNQFAVVPSVRIERQDLSSTAGYTDQFAVDQFQAASSQGFINVSQRLEARYTGVTNWVYYARGDWAEEQGNLNDSTIDLTTATYDLSQNTDYNRMTQKYTVGANWYPLRRLNLDLQYYHKIRQNNYEHDPSVVDGNAYQAYPADLTDFDFDMDDMNFRVTYRPWVNLTLVSRYDFQLSTIQQAGATTAEGQSGQIQSHILGESVTWIPLSWLYLQPAVNYVVDRTETPAQDLTGNAARLVTKGRNDYWDASLMAGVTLNAKTDLQAHYYYYRAADFVDNSAYSLPYGANTEDHGVTVTLIRRINEHMRVSLRYGYFNNRDLTSGQHLNYEAHLVYTSFQYRF